MSGNPTDTEDAPRNGTTDVDPGADGSSSPAACDYDLTDPDNLQAVWLTFQRERSAACPVTETAFELALAHDPAEDGGGSAEVLLACETCGRSLAFSPPDAKEIFGWAE